MKNCTSNRVKCKFLELRKQTQKECRKEHNKYINELISEPEQSCKKKLFSYIKSKTMSTSNNIMELKDTQGKVHQNAETKAEILNSQFCSVFSDPSGEILGDTKELNIPDMKKIKINSNGVEKLLSKIKENKATGPDDIPGKLLKHCAKELAPVLTILFQASLDQGKTPSEWKKANITPLYKKGDKTCPANYRPVSLTSITCKLLEHIVHSSIMDHFDQFQILTECQHGFRQKRSCESQLIETCRDFIQTIEDKKQTDAILLDFSKAFDKVHHKSLLHKLNAYGVRGNTHKWITSFLSERSQKVILENKESQPKPVQSGVPQGTVLGPLLFLTYINDIPQGLTEGTKLRLFADDSLLYRTIKNKRDTEILQEDLNKLQKWESDWRMEFHPQKCQVMTISNKKEIINSTYSIHNIELQKTNSAKYLGVTIDSGMKWTEHINQTCKKANKTLGFIKRHVSSCPKEVKKQCYQTYVKPILDYCGSVWDPHKKCDTRKLESIQRRAARFVEGIYDYQIKTDNILAATGWEPLEERRAKTKVILIHKAKHGELIIPTENLKTNQKYGTRRADNYEIPRSRTDIHLNSFYPSAIRLYNAVPTELKNIKDITSFKTKLDNTILRTSY